MSNRATRANGSAAALAATEGPGQELTELPALNPAGLNLQDYATYVRKLTTGGAQDFRIPLGDLIAQVQLFTATNKAEMRSFTPSAAKQLCFCLGGTIPFDNQAGIYVTVVSTDQDNNGDRIRPNVFTGLVWYKWM